MSATSSSPSILSIPTSGRSVKHQPIAAAVLASAATAAKARTDRQSILNEAQWPEASGSAAVLFQLGLKRRSPHRFGTAHYRPALLGWSAAELAS
ncbi:MAG: hypothetical protein INR68_01420 [Methylobacterium mesophilicum]|nr:hypothetical protein [Methylobacterium mesophilicum]